MTELYLGPNREELLIQMCLVGDVGDRFVKVTYYLEGNYYIAPRVYAKIEELSIWLETVCTTASKNGQANFMTLLGMLPNVRSAVEYIGNPETWKTQRAIIRMFLDSLYKYYQERFNFETGSLKHIIQIFKAIRIFDVPRVTERKMGPADIIELCSIPVFEPYKDRLLKELPNYLAKCHEVANRLDGDDSGFNPLEWFKICGNEISAFKECSKSSALFVATSAAAERVFSMYERMFDDDQNSALKDYRTCAIMLRFNELQRSKLDK
jgi:hypothetical protein